MILVSEILTVNLQVVLSRGRDFGIPSPLAVVLTSRMPERDFKPSDYTSPLVKKNSMCRPNVTLAVNTYSISWRLSSHSVLEVLAACRVINKYSPPPTPSVIALVTVLMTSL
ncbi:hypothetical protein RRG08_043496 [Elysia crispata]|uniref:Uncharacterized protein n=1 Tax=Elysia crispata TaxID=231223 RepID=A0AAE0YFC2_9GAST|nr:hypothetical protein RRG08_043496 [Elysia crispata]